MKYGRERHHRRSIRLKGYDYSQAGGYFVTICAKDRAYLFGDVMDCVMKLNQYGKVVLECWKWLSLQYAYVELDEFIVMPNHLHGIVVITDNCRGGSRTAPTIKRKPLGRLLGAFKTVSTKRINKMAQTENLSIWQRNYYEHIIRNEDELNRIREYVVMNPEKWQFDRENPNQVENKTYTNQWKWLEGGK